MQIFKSKQNDSDELLEALREKTEFDSESEEQAVIDGVDTSPAPEHGLCEVQGERSLGESDEQHETSLDDQEGETKTLSAWISENATIRQSEIDYIHSIGLDLPDRLTNGTEIRVPLRIESNVMLLVIDGRFPKPNENGLPNIKAYFVLPIPSEIACAGNMRNDYYDIDDDGNAYLHIDKYEQILKKYLTGKLKMLLTEYIIRKASLFFEKLAAEKAEATGTLGINETNRRVSETSRYDGRHSRGNIAVHPKCKKIVLSNRSLTQIFCETQARINTETGGLLLGHYENGIWYVAEACDPGWNAIFQMSYHEADENYENHVCSVISRIYKHPLIFLGMWHRHPGSMDTFSSIDDITNTKYAEVCGNGCISALVNYDPDFRMTFYYVDIKSKPRLEYTNVRFEVGDDRFSNPRVLQIASIEDVINRNFTENIHGRTNRERSYGGA